MSAPLLVVTKGNPDDHEIAAATVAVLALLQSTRDKARFTPRDKAGFIPGRTTPEPGRAPGWVRDPGYTPPGFWATSR
ncbi:Acyl-CoA carboxylase epsilon subunit [Amycolatopsis xylanica]|uniref:Acyl-CoA carboxylase epsilon subunit n=1 Tax=Amycolatopsis xylanica TaxID=589385 RepID=A0A1H3NGU4_9PSEU|nr:acyl-CoA carboxylase epsilon subunit [Amycolatopsis xylanica]SDY87890.1 Acyl-CoA carboxylase epsilon subunit [Amycolatopsis xylanica]